MLLGSPIFIFVHNLFSHALLLTHTCSCSWCHLSLLSSHCLHDEERLKVNWTILIIILAPFVQITETRACSEGRADHTRPSLLLPSPPSATHGSSMPVEWPAQPVSGLNPHHYLHPGCSTPLLITQVTAVVGSSSVLVKMSFGWHWDGRTGHSHSQHI